MSAREMKQLLAAFVDGYEEQVDRAPVLSAEEIQKRINKSATTGIADLQVLYSLAKSIKVGAVDLTDVN